MGICIVSVLNVLNVCTCLLHIKYIQINKIDMIKIDAGINGKSDHKSEIIKKKERMRNQLAQ